MYIKINSTQHPCVDYRASTESASFVGVTGVTPPVLGEIILYADDGFVMARQSVGDYARQTYESGVLTLTNAPEPEGPSIEELAAAKFAELDAACEAAIFAGVDVTTSFGTLHYPLTDRDQDDLAFFNQLYILGAPGWLYNAQGQDHIFYPIADLKIIVDTGLGYVTYCRTLNSALRKLVNREAANGDREALAAITFATELPPDLAAEFAAKMAMLPGGGA